MRAVEPSVAAVGLMFQAGALGSTAYRAPGRVDPTFEAGSGVNNIVRLIAVQPDGKVLLGGGFTEVNGRTRGAFARLHADGNPDEEFNQGAGANGSVRSIAGQADGGVLIGGFFQAVNGASRRHLARLRPDGTLDGAFDPGPGPRSGVILLSVRLSNDAGGSLLGLRPSLALRRHGVHGPSPRERMICMKDCTLALVPRAKVPPLVNC